MKTKNGQKIKTLSGTATVIETNDAGVKIKHDQPNGLGQEEWLSYGQVANSVVETNHQHSNVGEKFNVKTTSGTVQMVCTEWTEELRKFVCESGSIEMDWMEYLDQFSLGRISKA